MAKKAKGKAKGKGKGKDKQPEIPAEWVGKSVEELEALVAGLESQLTSARQGRNRAQCEHEQMQSFYDVSREQIRELDMRIERKDLEIEHAEEDNATELRLYEQKAKFIKYCHVNRLREASDESEQRIAETCGDHGEHLQNLEAGKADTRSALVETQEQHREEIGSQQQADKEDSTQMKERLDADVKAFEAKCDDLHLQLQRDLDSRRVAALSIVESRRESHLNDLAESHRRRCDDMRTYFEGVERQQQMDMEDLEAEIRRLKKAATQNELDSNELQESNERCGEELQMSEAKVSVLETQTKDKEKDATSLRSTNARLAATRKSIREATGKFAALEERFAAVQEEREGFRNGLDRAMYEACRADSMKHQYLGTSVREIEGHNAVLESHLQHIVGTAGLDSEKKAQLESNLDELLRESTKEKEELELQLAKATKSYNKALKSCT